MSSRNLYYLMIGIGAIAGVVVFWILLFTRKNEKKSAGKAFGTAAIALGLASGVSFGAGLVLHPPMVQALGSGQFVTAGFQYYLTAVGFLLLYRFLLKTFKLPPAYADKAVVPILVFSLLSRVGCLIAGCCSGKTFGGFTYPAVGMEIVFSVVLSAVFLVRRTEENRMTIFLVAYSLFRFITEFLRLNSGISTLLGLNLRQYVAIAVILYYGILSLFFKKEEKVCENAE